MVGPLHIFSFSDAFCHHALRYQGQCLSSKDKTWLSDFNTVVYFFADYLQKKSGNHNEVLLVLHPFTYYFFRMMSADPHIQEVDLFEGWLRQYFSDGYDYREILHFLDKNHNTSISMRTLLRKVKSYGLQRRHQAPLPNQLLELAYQRIISLTQGFGSSNGYRYIWHILNREGIRIPRIRVQ